MRQVSDLVSYVVPTNRQLMLLPLLQVGDSLEEFLLTSTDDGKLRQLMMSMSEAIRTIAFKVCKTPLGVSPAHKI